MALSVEVKKWYLFDKYFFRIFIRYFVWTLFLFIFLFLFVKMFNELPSLLQKLKNDEKVNFLEVLLYYCYGIPQYLLQTLSFVSVFSFIYSCATLSRGNELVALVGVGIPMWRITQSAILFSFLLSILLVIFQLSWFPVLKENYDTSENAIKFDRSDKTIHLLTYAGDAQVGKLYARSYVEKNKSLHSLMYFEWTQGQEISRWKDMPTPIQKIEDWNNFSYSEQLENMKKLVEDYSDIATFVRKIYYSNSAIFDDATQVWKGKSVTILDFQPGSYQFTFHQEFDLPLVSVQPDKLINIDDDVTIMTLQDLRAFYQYLKKEKKDPSTFYFHTIEEKLFLPFQQFFLILIASFVVPFFSKSQNLALSLIQSFVILLLFFLVTQIIFSFIEVQTLSLFLGFVTFFILYTLFMLFLKRKQKT